MRCPSCLSTDTTCVLNTVHRDDGSVRRRRGCRLCQIRWTTYEDLEPGSLIKAFVPRPMVGGESRTSAGHGHSNDACRVPDDVEIGAIDGGDVGVEVDG